MIQGALTTKAHGLRGSWESLLFQADSELKAEVVDFEPEQGRGLLKLALLLENLVSQDRKSREQCPFARVARASVSSSIDIGDAAGPRVLAAKVDGAQLFWDDFRAKFGADIHARLVPGDRTAEDPALRDAAKLDFRVRSRDLHLRAGKNKAEGWETSVPRLSLHGALREGRARRTPLAATRSDSPLSGLRGITGAIQLRTERAKGRIGETELLTDVNADLAVTSLDFDTQEAKVDGQIQLTNTEVHAGDERVRGWWAHVDVDSTLFRVADNLDISGMFRARLRDATAGLAPLSAAGELPDWITSVLPLREMDVTGSVNRRCRLTDIRFTNAEGGPLVATGRLQSAREAVRGAFLVQLSAFEAISAGIHFSPKETDVSLFAGSSWLDARIEELDGRAKQSIESPCPASESGECSR